jgi:aminoglycoside phosphotransferase (APT) family kinase protein
MTMHEGEVPIDAALVGRLIAAQFPEYADLPLEFVRSTGTVNAIYRLGGELPVRVPRVETWARDLEKELEWLPRLAPQLSLMVPEPVGRGRAAEGYPSVPVGDLSLDRRRAIRRSAR